MGLDLSKLENVRHRGATVIARCPACAETGNDRKGEHLFIKPNDKFGCVVSPGTDGRKHRQRIFELAGIRSTAKTGFSVKCPSYIISEQKAVQINILGRLGHIKSTHARKEVNSSISQNKNNYESINSVPSVPEDSENLYSPNELKMLLRIDEKSLQKIDEIKWLFGGMVVSIVDIKPSCIESSA